MISQIPGLIFKPVESSLGWIFDIGTNKLIILGVELIKVIFDLASEGWWNAGDEVFALLELLLP